MADVRCCATLAGTADRLIASPRMCDRLATFHVDGLGSCGHRDHRKQAILAPRPMTAAEVAALVMRVQTAMSPASRGRMEWRVWRGRRRAAP